MKAQTIDEVIGSNLRRLRESESLTLAQYAGTLTFLVGESFSEAKLSRWETGRYHFKMDDLLLMSRIHGVNILGLFIPGDRTVTHIRVGDSLYPIDRYRTDFFLDPRGSFRDRATDIAERKRHGAWDVDAALDDMEKRLGEKGGIGDFHSTFRDMFGGLERYAKQIEDGNKALEQLGKDLQERIDDGDTEEDE